MSDYAAFLATKRRLWTGCGRVVPIAALPDGLYPFQAALTRWALQKGRAALFADTGLGKTRMQVAWAAFAPKPVLIFAPLCVGVQTIREAEHLGITVSPHGSGGAIQITNYERLHQVDPAQYQAVVLDESSILKAFDGKTRTRLIHAFRDTPMRLCCTATPAPNDIAELANHCEFLGIMTRAEMLATFFVHDENGWRLKGHAHEAFYRWLAGWGMFLRRPSDLGFEDTGYQLPGLEIREDVVAHQGPVGATLFPEYGLGGIRGRQAVRRDTVETRAGAVVRRIRATPGAWLVWCGLNTEQDLVAAALGDEAVSVQGSDAEAVKTSRIGAFLSGQARILVTKPTIAGFGLNLQHCAQMAFLGLGDSYEQYYQAIRRCYRFGQTRPVTVWLVVSDAERAILHNVQRKERDADRLAAALVAAMRESERIELGVTREREAYDPQMPMEVPAWLTA